MSPVYEALICQRCYALMRHALSIFFRYAQCMPFYGMAFATTSRHYRHVTVVHYHEYLVTSHRRHMSRHGDAYYFRY